MQRAFRLGRIRDVEYFVCSLDNRIAEEPEDSEFATKHCRADLVSTAAAVRRAYPQYRFVMMSPACTPTGDEIPDGHSHVFRNVDDFITSCGNRGDWDKYHNC